METNCICDLGTFSEEKKDRIEHDYNYTHTLIPRPHMNMSGLLPVRFMFTHACMHIRPILTVAVYQGS